MDPIEVLLTATGGVVAGVGTDRLALRRERRRSREALRRAAGQRLLEALRDLRWLFRESQERALPPEAWSQAILTLASANDDVGQRLPAGWRHLMRSVRAATGEFVGAVCLADLDTRVHRAPLSQPDERWRQYGMEYLDFAIHWLQAWTDDPQSRRLSRYRMPDYDWWLAETGRHGEPQLRRRHGRLRRLASSPCT